MVFRVILAVLALLLLVSEATAQTCAPGVPCWSGGVAPNTTRPASPIQGLWGFNTTTGQLEWYVDATTKWLQANPADTLIPESFGAVGDGVADDRQEMQAALNACFARGGGVVQLSPTKRYFISAPGLTLNQGCVLKGGTQPGSGKILDPLTWALIDYVILLDPAGQINRCCDNGGAAAIDGVYILASNFNLAAGADLRDNLTNTQNFKGTAIFASQKLNLMNSTIIGFNTCAATRQNQVFIDNLHMDCYNGIVSDANHDTSRITNAEVTYYATQASNEISNVLGIGWNGSGPPGLWRITLPTDSIAQTGDLVNLFGFKGAFGLNKRWVVTRIGPRVFDLQNSSATAAPTSYTANGALTYGTVQVPISTTLANFANIAVGQYVSGTGIQTGTTVAAVWPQKKLIFLNLPATASGSAVSLTFGNPGTSVATTATTKDVTTTLTVAASLNPWVQNGNVVFNHTTGLAVGLVSSYVNATGVITLQGAAFSNGSVNDEISFLGTASPHSVTATGTWTTGVNTIPVPLPSALNFTMRPGDIVVDTTYTPDRFIGYVASHVGTVLTLTANAANANSGGTDSLSIIGMSQQMVLSAQVRNGGTTTASTAFTVDVDDQVTVATGLNFVREGSLVYDDTTGKPVGLVRDYNTGTGVIRFGVAGSQRFAWNTSSGSTDSLRIITRGFSCTDSEGLQMVNLTSQTPEVGYYLGHDCGWAICLNCGVDSNATMNGLTGGVSNEDTSQVGMWYDSTVFANSFQGHFANISRQAVNTAEEHSGHTNSIIGTGFGGTFGPLSTILEHSGTGPLIVDNSASPSPQFIFVGNGAGQLTLGDNNFSNAIPYYESFDAIQNVTGSGTTFDSTQGNKTLYPETPQVQGSITINGDMTIDQFLEGTALSACGAVATPSLHTDRWRCLSGLGTPANGGTLGRQASGGFPNYPYALQFSTAATTTAPTSTQQSVVQQQIEGSELASLNWNTNFATPVVLDFCAKGSSIATGNYSGFLRAGNVSWTFVYNMVAPTTTWQCFSYVIPGTVGGSAVGSLPNTMVLTVGFDLGSGTNFQTATTNTWQTNACNGANTCYAVTGANQLVTQGTAPAKSMQWTAVHLRQGTKKLAPYIPYPYPFELARTQRFYQKSFQGGQIVTTNPSTGLAGANCVMNPVANGRPSIYVPLRPMMETTPTVVVYNPLAASNDWRNTTTNGAITATVDTNSRGQGGFMISAATVANIAENVCIHWTADTGN